MSKEFDFISTLLAEDRHHQSVAKWVTFNIVQHILSSCSIRLVYLSDSHQLIAMAPYTIHEAPIHHFSKHINKMLSKLSLDDDNNVTMELHTNLAIEDDAVNNLIIPNFHLDLCSHCNSRSPSVPLWIGEIGFSSGVSLMKHQLASAARMAPESDFAFMVSIQEKVCHFPPTDHPLCSHPILLYATFEQLISANVTPLAPVVVEDVCWAKIKSITFHYFLQEDNGQFNFSGKGSLCAQGVCLPWFYIYDYHWLLILSRHYSPTWRWTQWMLYSTRQHSACFLRSQTLCRHSTSTPQGSLLTGHHFSLICSVCCSKLHIRIVACGDEGTRKMIQNGRAMICHLSLGSRSVSLPLTPHCKHQCCVMVQQLKLATHPAKNANTTNTDR